MFFVALKTERRPGGSPMKEACQEEYVLKRKGKKGGGQVDGRTVKDNMGTLAGRFEDLGHYSFSIPPFQGCQAKRTK